MYHCHDDVLHVFLGPDVEIAYLVVRVVIYVPGEGDDYGEDPGGWDYPMEIPFNTPIKDIKETINYWHGVTVGRLGLDEAWWGSFWENTQLQDDLTLADIFPDSIIPPDRCLLLQLCNYAFSTEGIRTFSELNGYGL